MTREPEIRCPKCDYRPRAEDRWSCTPSCGTVWNTFWTAGVCPGCGYPWQVTQCPACHVISPHKDWYRFPGADPEGASDEEAAPRTAEA